MNVTRQMVSMANTKKISGKEMIGEILDKNPETVEIFMKSGFHCLGCPMSRMETLEQGCKAHGMSDKEIIAFIGKLNKKLKK